MRKITVAANFYNEIDNLPEWFPMAKAISDTPILIVDSGSTDGTIEYCLREGAVVIVDDMIVREGCGFSRNYLRSATKRFFPSSYWLLFLDGDERIEDAEALGRLKNMVDNNVDVIAFPRVEWYNKEKTEKALSFVVYHGRMTKLESPVRYIRKIRVIPCNYTKLFNSSIKMDHFHFCAPPEKRRHANKLWSKLYFEDPKRNSYNDPLSVKYREIYLKEGL